MSKSECNQFIDGILLANKPQGLSSNAFLQQVRWLFRAKKAGHTGSLDPLATGMLPICFGEATKFCQYLLEADKVYEARGLLGIKTNTADAYGEMIAQTSNFQFSLRDLEEVLSEFRGTIKQVPSMFSALKYQGIPLYKYAREGLTIDRQAREIIIHELELIAFDGRTFDIKVSCSKGTYIRNLVEDIGERLRVGAHVTSLHRLSTAGFLNEPMYSLEDLKHKSARELSDCLLPLERAVNYLPTLNLQADEILALRQGKTLSKMLGSDFLGCLRLYGERGEFIGLGEYRHTGSLAVKRLLALNQ